MPYTEDRAAWFQGQELWQHIPEADWRDWIWQLKNRITTTAQLEELMTLTPDEKAGCEYANQKLALAITPYFFNLVDRDDPDCPIRKQVIPRAGEMVIFSPNSSSRPLSKDLRPLMNSSTSAKETSAIDGSKRLAPDGSTSNRT